MQFPDDENGDVLRRMQSSGDDLTKSRDIDFTVVFPDESSARQFAAAFGSERYYVPVRHSECVADLPWDVEVRCDMVPDHAAIGAFEERLEALAAPLGGRNDGWGCFHAAGV